jgi:hypothetical protein
MSGLASSLNYYRAAGSIPRSTSDKNLPYYISTGNITISGVDPDLLWIQSSLSPISGSVYRLWNLQMVASTNLVDMSQPLRINIGIGFPLTFREDIPLTGNFSISPSQELYNAYRYWTVESIGGSVILTLQPSSLSLAPGYVEFYLNLFISTNLL